MVLKKKKTGFSLVYKSLSLSLFLTLSKISKISSISFQKKKKNLIIKERSILREEWRRIFCERMLSKGNRNRESISFWNFLKASSRWWSRKRKTRSAIKRDVSTTIVWARCFIDAGLSLEGTRVIIRDRNAIPLDSVILSAYLGPLHRYSSFAIKDPMNDWHAFAR